MIWLPTLVMSQGASAMAALSDGVLAALSSVPPQPIDQPITAVRLGSISFFTALRVVRYVSAASC
ncbi:hypothetical protein [Streptomyces mirabilis]|uniref:hypothetical protein n=1 Tax=Streptomyces mirabilis TaxID=68239 RepID=UPI002E32D6C1|nr:hypothetical protein [Streptomyces mirabilis]